MEAYFDHAATTKVSDSALKAMLDCYTRCWGNPSAQHGAGQRAKEKLEQARAQMAQCLHCQTREIYFTSGGTESDNQAVLTGAEAGRRQGKMHIVTTAFEHHGVLHPLKKLENQGFSVTYLKIDPETHNITPEQVQAAIRPDTCLVSVMYANNEIGSILPIREIGAICRSAGVLLHVDAVQAVGHIPVDVVLDQVDLLSLSAHKFGGPQGVGALFARRGLQPERLLEGGGQERGKRPGTENVPAICGMAAALTESCSQMEESTRAITAMAEKIRDTVKNIPGSHENGDPRHRLPGIVSFSFEGVAGETLLILLDGKGIRASAGSACTSGSLEPSHVLLAAGRSPELAAGTLRLSLGSDNTMEQTEYLCRELPGLIQSLQNTQRGR